MNIIVVDETMNQSWVYVPTREGYAEAYAKIQEIIGVGHKVGGDVSRVMSFMG